MDRIKYHLVDGVQLWSLKYSRTIMNMKIKVPIVLRCDVYSINNH